MNPVRRIGIFANLDKPVAFECAKKAVSHLVERVDQIVLQPEVAQASGYTEYAGTEEEICNTEAAIVFGGDGTLIRVARLCVPSGTPMLGINLGHFGFLNDIAPENLIPTLDRLLAGYFQVSERLTLECLIKRADRVIHRDIALNEVVIAHGRLARLLNVKIHLNGAFLTRYTADGVMVATPTGSTAYSLSAGGPLVHPSIKTMILTPICPHTLINRSLLIPDEHEIAISVNRADGDLVQVTVDGQRGLPMENADIALVRNSFTPAKLITHIGGALFYQKLQVKLHVGESN